jgi:hypothetical protein
LDQNDKFDHVVAQKAVNISDMFMAAGTEWLALAIELEKIKDQTSK